MKFSFRLLLLVALAATVFVYARFVALAESASAETDNRPKSKVTIHGIGTDGEKLAVREGRESVSGPLLDGNARLVTSADFDADGVADLVVADDAGFVKFFKGNSRYLLDSSLEPFSDSAITSNAGVAPDYLEHGDFNADGKQDLIAARIGDSTLKLLAGKGDGLFAMPQSIELDGVLTALAVGEFGRADGQTDVAVGESSGRASRLRIFENPAGAFKHKPEIVRLIEPARFIAMGLLGADGYSDIAVGGTASVVLIQGRGQVAPWDTLRPGEFERPQAIVSTRRVGGRIAGLAVGQFDAGSDLAVAVLTDDGAIRTFAPPSTAQPTNFSDLAPVKSEGKSVSFLPSESDAAEFSAFDPGALRDEMAQRNAVVTSDQSGNPAPDGRAFRENLRRDAEEMSKLTTAERDAFIASVKNDQAVNDSKSRENFLKTVAAVPVDFRNWSEKTIVRDASLSNGRGLVKVRVGYSGKDDFAVIDGVANRLNFVAETIAENGIASPQIFAFETDGEPVAALPMRLNLDAKSDFVVLRKGASRPSLMMSAPSLALVVTTNTDSFTDCLNPPAPCSLRSAILLANSNPGTSITFNIAGQPLISPFNELPVILGNGTVISASTQDGPGVEIDGTNAGLADGIKIRTSDAVVSGLAINSFNGMDNGNGSVIGGNGITIESTALSPNNGNNWVLGNYLGTDLTGTVDKGNFVGLNIFDSHDNLIGHTDPDFVQVISGNGDRPNNEEGLGIIATNSIRARFYGNIVGTDVNAQTAIPNLMGVFLTGSNNDFGGDGFGQANLVSGNRAPELSGFGNCTGEGIRVVTLFSVDGNGDPVNRLTFGNLIKGNFIGTDGSGTSDLGNCREGILLSPDTATSIGSITEGGRNTVSGNGYGGISCLDISAITPDITTDFGFCAISGNNVGTDVFGNGGIPNDYEGAIGGFNIVTFNGINVYHNLNFGVVGLPIGFDIGGSCTGLCNLVNGVIYRSGKNGDVGVFSNYTGVNKTGVIGLANYPVNYSRESGIWANRGNTTIGEYGSIDNVPTSFGNLISGSYCGGLILASSIRDDAFGRLAARANRIGTDASGIVALPNNTAGPASCGEAGASLFNFYGNIEFGTDNPNHRNTVSGNLGNGLNVQNDGGQLVVANTAIGVNVVGQPLGNEKNGIQVTGGGSTMIGGTGPNLGNVIRHNQKAGVALLALGEPTARSVTIVGNSIFANGELGIDLMRVDGTFPFPNDGVNQNDCFDGDDGANSLQNYPELLTPGHTANGAVTVDGGLRSAPLGNFRIDFYASSGADSSDHGEGETYLGSLPVTTDGNGFHSFSFTSDGPVDPSLVITATATNEFGDTSEFSCIAGGCGNAAKSLADLTSAPTVSCAGTLQVNVPTDEPDADLNDTICDVDVSTNNGLQCSLRAAIQQAAANGTPEIIYFDIPGDGPRIISPTSPLPPLSKVISIDGTSQPGYGGVPLIEIRGTNLPPDASGLVVRLAGTVIDGLAINSFDGVGIMAGNRTTIRHCHLGLGADGMTRPTDEFTNQTAGINSTGDGIVVENNVFAFNEAGLAGRLNNAKISGNFFGLNREGRSFEGILKTQDYGILARAGQGIVIGSKSDLPEERNVVGNSAFTGFELENVSDAVIRGNYVGLDAGGEVAAPNGQVGIKLIDSSRSLIRNNLVGANGIAAPDDVGAGIAILRGDGNTLTENRIGLSANGEPRPNRLGITIESNNNRIGTVSQPNTVCWSLNVGIAVIQAFAIASTNNRVEGNKVGVNNDEACRNHAGIRLAGNVKQTTVTQNIVSGNDFGVDVLKVQFANTISDNTIGLNSSGTAAIPNQTGVAIAESQLTRVTGNVVSGNSEFGILIGNLDPGLPSNDNVVSANKIGTDRSGTMSFSNGGAGIIIIGDAKNNLIGGTTVADGNIVSGNTNPNSSRGIGIVITGDTVSAARKPTGNEVYRNRVGLAADTDDFVPNNYGMLITNAPSNKIGGPGAGNFVSGNVFDGIKIRGADASTNQIGGNQVTFNNDNGIEIAEGAFQNVVGGPTEGSGNVIANNVGAGVRLSEDAGEGNLVDPNSIFGNGGLGIDLNAPGLTLNDPLDEDGGANRGQNYPTIGGFSIDANGDLIVSFSVDSDPGNSDYGTEGLYVEFFEADAGGEGAQFLGSTRYLVSDYNGALAGIKTVNLGNAAALGITTGDQLTATATDAQNNTSEFTPAFVPTAAGVELSGRVLNAALMPLPNAVVQLRNLSDGSVRSARVNSFGRYRFNDVAAGETYLVSVSAKAVRFSPSERVLRVEDNVADLDFVADR